MMSRRGFLALCSLLGLSACACDSTDAAELVPGKDLYAVWYRYGGGMDGGSDSIELCHDDEGRVVLSWSFQSSWSERADEGSMRLDESAFDRFEDLAEEYKLRAAAERPDSEIQALDAAAATITFAYVGEGGGMDADSMFSVSTSQDLSYKQREGFWATIDALEALVPS